MKHSERDLGMDAKLTGQTDLAGFRAEARQLLAQQVPPEEVHWVLDLDPAHHYRDPEPALASRPRSVARAATAIVPASFTRLCEFVVLHRDPQRFALLYRLLWRLVHEPGLRNDPVDGDMIQAQHMAHAVRRDIHKMKANQKLRPVLDASGQEWHFGTGEPAHHIVEAVAPWFCKRGVPSHWVLFTPDRSARCEGGKLVFGPGVRASELPNANASPDDWLACYGRVFRTHDEAHA